MSVLDVFSSDAFGLISMTEAINALPYKPSRIGDMGLFASQGITTTSVMIEERNGILALLPTRRRGEPPSVGTGPGRTARSFTVPHIPHEDTIRPEDVQNVRAFGSSDETAGVAKVVNDRLSIMRQSHEVTEEYHRIGAINGTILDSDGATTIYDLFTEFGVVETEVDFVLDDAATDVRAKCLEVIRAVESGLGAAAYDHIHSFCDANWFEAFVGHPYIRDAYHRWRDSENLRNDPRKGFVFGGITFEEYRGTVSGVDFMPSDTARFFPVGVPSLFVSYYAPADFMETVNTVGIPVYAKQEPLPMNRGIRLHTQSNPLCLCTRPACLIKGT
jgi:hypothetical protein